MTFVEQHVEQCLCPADEFNFVSKSYEKILIDEQNWIKSNISK